MAWVAWNPNPMGRRVGDCAVRAVARAIGVDWEMAYAEIALAGYMMGDMPSSDSVWGAVLRKHGFRRAAIPEELPEDYTAERFCLDHPTGVYVLAFGGHVTAVENGNLYDIWDSSDEIPQFYFYRKDEP